MAVVALEKLEDQLNCSICLDTYTNPKQLQCHHVYCQQCLVKLVIRDRQGQLSLTCPNCRQVTSVPANGVAGLQAAFQINKFLEIVEEHKKVKVASPEKEEGASTSPTPHDNVTVCCPEHSGREVELYCNTCEETICYKCIKKGEKHQSHDYEELDEAFKRYKEEITSSLEPMEKQLRIIKTVLAQFDARCDEISDQEAAIEADIDNKIAQLYKTLDIRKTKLIGQLHQLTRAKLKSLAAQRDQVETTQAQLSSCLLFMRENLKTGNQGEVLMMKSTTTRQVKELTATFQQDTLKPNTEADMIFTALENFTEECQKYGRVSTADLVDPSKCYATGEGVETAAIGEKSTVILQALNFKNRPCEIPTISITSNLVSEITGSGSAKRDQYEISYQPTKGKHQLHIKVEGQHIRGSPFPVTVRSPVEKLGTSILTIDEVIQPEGVAVNHRGEMVVTERGKDRISVFSPSGQRLQSFGTGNWTPIGVTVDGKGNVLVTDLYNHCIQKFTEKGEFITAVGTLGNGPLQFHCPCSIAYNASNGKVYVGSLNHSIQILNSDLSLYGSFGKKGNGKGEFNHPEHIAFDSTGNVYVADCKNHRIQVFTAKGKFLGMFGQRGEGRGELNRPHGVAVDSSGRVYVSERKNCRVSVFTSKGQFVTSFGSEGSGPGQFKEPRRLAVDSSGVVYVCDFGNNRVQLF